MNIISTTDISRPGNDCYLYETVSLVEQFDHYAVIRCFKATGWAASNNGITILFASADKALAEASYKDYCRFYKR